MTKRLHKRPPSPTLTLPNLRKRGKPSKFATLIDLRRADPELRKRVLQQMTNKLEDTCTISRHCEWDDDDVNDPHSSSSESFADDDECDEKESSDEPKTRMVLLWGKWVQVKTELPC